MLLDGIYLVLFALSLLIGTLRGALKEVGVTISCAIGLSCGMLALRAASLLSHLTFWSWTAQLVFSLIVFVVAVWVIHCVYGFFSHLHLDGRLWRAVDHGGGAVLGIVRFFFLMLVCELFFLLLYAGEPPGWINNSFFSRYAADITEWAASILLSSE